TLRDERRRAGHRRGADSAQLPQLVPAELSVRLRHVPVCVSGRRAAHRRPRMSPAFRLGVARPRQAAPWGPDLVLAPFARDVRDRLMQVPKTLPSKYLYDPLGSALFEAICRLPWYGVTRAEQRLLGHEAAAIGRAADPAFIAELGP